MRHLLAVFALMLTASQAAALDFRFPSIDGGEIDMQDWAGQPVLVVNTASRCAFTGQYDALQELYDRYRTDGLVVLAVPSNDFKQELGSDEAVKDFCELNFGIDMPMTTITAVRGGEAHPFYAWLRETAGFEPAWNFNKVLIDPDGRVTTTWGSTARPMSPAITREIEALIPQARG